MLTLFRLALSPVLALLGLGYVIHTAFIEGVDAAIWSFIFVGIGLKLWVPSEGALIVAEEDLRYFLGQAESDD